MGQGSGEWVGFGWVGLGRETFHLGAHCGQRHGPQEPNTRGLSNYSSLLSLETEQRRKWLVQLGYCLCAFIKSLLTLQAVF